MVLMLAVPISNVPLAACISSPSFCNDDVVKNGVALHLATTRPSNHCRGKKPSGLETDWSNRGRIQSGTKNPTNIEIAPRKSGTHICD